MVEPEELALGEVPVGHIGLQGGCLGLQAGCIGCRLEAEWTHGGAGWCSPRCSRLSEKCLGTHIGLQGGYLGLQAGCRLDAWGCSPRCSRLSEKYREVRALRASKVGESRPG